MTLALTDRAVKSRAAGLDLAADHAATTRAQLAGAVVDGEIVLEIAELAVGADVIPERGAPGGNGGLEHRADGLRQALGALERLARRARDGARRPVGRQPRPPQRL